MPLYALDDKIWFPPVTEALDDGLLAIGGDLQIDRLLLAYQNGIFPWFDEGPPLWWSPDPRFVLYPDRLYISKSMQQVIKRKQFTFRTNTDFASVIAHCRELKRRDQDGTWITSELEASFNELHQMGIAHSAEAWMDDELVGGLYGIRMGPFFFGESMFSKESNASKFAFIQYVQQLKKESVILIDCQVHTQHLESLGAEMIPRNLFIEELKKHL